MLPCKDSDGYIWEKVNQKERAEITCILVGIYCSIFFFGCLYRHRIRSQFSNSRSVDWLDNFNYLYTL